MARLLQQLRRRRIPVGILSSRRREDVQHRLSQLGFDRLVEVCHGRDSLRRPKPHPDALVQMAGELEAEPAELVFVGDSAADFHCARAAGVPYYHAGWSDEPVPQAVHTTAVVFESPRDLAEALLGRPSQVQTMDGQSLPAGLAEAVEKRDLCFYAGSGVSVPSGIGDWKGHYRSVLQELDAGYLVGDGMELPELLQLLAAQQERAKRVFDYFRDSFDRPDIQPNAYHFAMLRNTSAAYVWEPAMIVDIDVCLFVESLGREVGNWLLTLRERLRTALDSLGMDFDLRVLRGPYKPAAWRLARPVAIAHLAVFTEWSYQQLPLAIRWSWQKYRCVVEPDRLRATGEEPPGWQELRAMVARKLWRIEAGRIEMTEWELPDFVERCHEFTSDSPVFAEYSMAGPLVCARVHGRVLRRPEADRLGNRDYVAWYRREILDSAALAGLLAHKEIARQHGYSGLLPAVRELASRYLGELLERIEA